MADFIRHTVAYAAAARTNHENSTANNKERVRVRKSVMERYHAPMLSRPPKVQSLTRLLVNGCIAR